MGTTYLVYYEFSHTAGNHAGMAYLARYLDENLTQVQLVKNIPQEYKFGKYLSRIYAILLTYYLKAKLKKNDKIFFMEYLSKGFAHQEVTVDLLRKHGVKNKIYALVHLSGPHLMEVYNSEERLLKKLNRVDKLFVFGSSLKNFIQQLGYKKEVVRTFHYVDTAYYKPLPPQEAKAPAGLQVISMGSLKRNFTQLQEIVAGSPDVTFHVCMGKSNLGSIFEKLPNARLYGYMEESELLALMQICDVNLSVLEDTIGSNVITTSLAVGHIQVVSDVGSIRDYCDDGNAFFCTETKDFSEALEVLKKDKEKVLQMKQNAWQKAATLSKEVFLQDFQDQVVNQ